MKRLTVCCHRCFATLCRDDKTADIVDLSDEVSELKSNLRRLKSEVICRYIFGLLRPIIYTVCLKRNDLLCYGLMHPPTRVGEHLESNHS